ncbi:MAG: hypothetical protein ONA69_05895, partial [candidate division KSB1 bacterium]|nr:hypothetical protein [candidate division KSB1 bacterium]
MKLFWITLAVLSAAAAESPTAADPLSEPWRWRRFPQLEKLGIRCMAQGNDGTLWFGGTAGLAAYDGLNWQVYDSTAFDFNGQINAVLPTDSAVYISSHGGLWQLAEGKFQRIFPTAWPYWVEVSDMATVRNALYAATRFGILRYVRGQLTLYTLAEQEQAVKKLAPSAKVVFLPQRLAVREAWPEGAGFYAPSNLVTQMIVQGPAQQAGLLIGDYLPFFLSHPNFELFFLGSPSGSQAELQFL